MSGNINFLRPGVPIGVGGNLDFLPSKNLYPVSDALEGTSLYGYGHSYVSAGTAPQPATQYLERVAKRFGLTFVNRGQAASEMKDVATWIMRAIPFVPGTLGMVVVDAVINNVRFYGGSPGAIEAFKESLDLVIRMLRAGVRTDDLDPSIVYTGAWNNGSLLPDMNGVGASFTSTPGDYATIPFSGDEITVMSLKYKQGGTVGGVLEVTNSTGTQVLGSSTTSGGLPAVSAHAYHQIGVTVSGLGPGAHTVRARAGAAGGANPVWLDGFVTPSATPPLVVIMKGAPLNWTKPTNVNGSNDILSAYNQAIQAVVDRFIGKPVVAVDPTRSSKRGWTAARCVYTGDDVHPNNEGNAVYADAFIEAMAGTEFQNGLNAL